MAIKIKESVDIYLLDEQQDDVTLQFYKINTREKITIKASKLVLKLLSELDGKKELPVILENIKSKDSESLDQFIAFIISKGIAENCEQHEVNIDKKFSRQINFFDDFIIERTGKEAQIILQSKNIAFIGTGPIGALIAEFLVRAGVERITLIDYKKIEKCNSNRHFYFNKIDEGNYKAEALKKYLCLINPNVQVECKLEKIKPQTDLNDLLPEGLDLVVNSADEPYIGHTTIKLSRFLWPKGIALYVAGGFDAHLMSTGDFYIPNITICADCCANSFKSSLQNWKPKYIQPRADLVQNELVGWNGGLAAQALFSASYASSEIIKFLASGQYKIGKAARRGEYLINKGKMTWVEIKNNDYCEFCGGK